MTDQADTVTALVLALALATLLTIAALKLAINTRRQRRESQRRPPAAAAPPRTRSHLAGTATTPPITKQMPACPPAPQAPPPAPPNVPAAAGSAPAGTTPGGPPTTPRIVTRTGSNTSGAALVDPYTRAHKSWTPGEDRDLCQRYSSGCGVAAIAQATRIDQREVAIRLVTLLMAPQGRIDNDEDMPNARSRYTPDELRDLTSQYVAGHSLRSIADRAGRSQLGVGWRLLDLGIPRQVVRMK